MTAMLRYALCLAAVVAAVYCTPTQTSFPTNFHVWHQWSATNAVGGNLELSMILTEYNQDGGYQCDPLVAPFPQDDPINPMYPAYSLVRNFWNATTKTLYTALMNSTFDVTCTNRTAALPSWVFPTVPYTGEKVIDNRDVYVFTGNASANYTSAIWSQQVSDGIPVQTTYGTAQRTDINLYAEYIAPAPTRFVNCNQTWIIESCGQNLQAGCYVYRDADPSDINDALAWVCGPDGGVDCGPISPGGDHFEPNNPIAHGDYAFTQYFQAKYAIGGLDVCCFKAQRANARCIAAVAF